MRIKEKLAKLREGDLSAVENVREYSERILRDDSNAFIYVDDPSALRHAKEVDKKIKDGTSGKLAGLVLGIKSNINVRGFNVTCASKTLEGYISPYDAEVIKRIRKEDGIIIGMTNMDEFACGSSGETSAFGPTKNPVAKGYITGGSSSGSAAAVSGRLCDLSLGSDTGGSIRNPASHCGIVGVKPSYGLVPREGLIDLAMSLDQIGPFSQDVHGSALLLNVISGYNAKECNTLNINEIDYISELDIEPRGLVVGVSKQFEDETDERISKLINKCIDRMQAEFDLRLKHIDLPLVDRVLVAYYPLVYVEFFSATRKFDGRRYGKKIEEVCFEEVGRRIELGRHISQKEVRGKYYKKALQTRGIVREAFANAFKRCDVIVSATVPKLPHKLGEEISPLDMYSYDLLTTPTNLAGICAGVVPAGKIDGIPIGIQFQADKLQEAKLLRFMRAWEKLKEN